jgi:hypothetical protein
MKKLRLKSLRMNSSRLLIHTHASTTTTAAHTATAAASSASAAALLHLEAATATAALLELRLASVAAELRSSAHSAAATAEFVTSLLVRVAFAHCQSQRF